MIVKLKRSHFYYLNNSFSEENRELKLKQVREEDSFVFIDVDDDKAIKIRDWAMDKQIQVGFDINYVLTPEGETLEELIDSFYTN